MEGELVFAKFLTYMHLAVSSLCPAKMTRILKSSERYTRPRNMLKVLPFETSFDAYAAEVVWL
jgi:hypothetical protein